MATPYLMGHVLHLLIETALVELKPLILHQYFNAVDLSVARIGEGEILEFCGVGDDNIEMLFVARKRAAKASGHRLPGMR